MTVRDIPLAQWRTGALVEYDGEVFKTYRRTRVKPGGWTLSATAADGAGGWDSEPVNLFFANEKAIVRVLEVAR